MGTSALSFVPSIVVKRGKNHIFKMVDEAKVKYICDIYDWDGKGEIDLFFLGDVMYALGLNITKKACVAQGGYSEYLELLKLYDKNSNGTMMLAELDNILCNLGDEVPKDDVQKLFAELCDPGDEDGLFPYMSFLDRLTGKA